jgi:hypothetical protein
MELSDLLNAGAIAAIVANALNSLLSIVLLRIRGGQSYPTAQDHLLTMLLHLCAGVGLGLVFWLSWGFTALVAITWWQRGLAFALLLWATLCVPFVIHVTMSQRARIDVALGVTLQWLTTLVLVGLACSWSWSQGR